MEHSRTCTVRVSWFSFFLISPRTESIHKRMPTIELRKLGAASYETCLHLFIIVFFSFFLFREAPSNNCHQANVRRSLPFPSLISLRVTAAAIFIHSQVPVSKAS
eukprot:TRINITY_DN12867_c0_g2_i1.p1 TRINITY_DN12867_c0_g2~~TRINITY_DN12867_c0_g2_i1.p1  ORF type:complete len:105 (+),score=2.45 TRINITY_DN12867_c0_g2_i1:324-638(+)